MKKSRFYSTMFTMNILVCNDDGIEAAGIRVLAAVLSKQHSVTVTAPDTERSGASHSLTFHSFLRYEKAEFQGVREAYKIYGTPADCVKFGVGNIMRLKPDLVVSGINKGPNIGSDIMYSGTVAAAFEAAYLGYRGIALSINKYADDIDLYTRAAEFLLKRLDVFLNASLPYNTILNINYPGLSADAVKGAVVTAAGHQDYSDVYVPDDKEEGRFWLRGEPLTERHRHNGEDCDIEWIKKGYITVTPVTFNATDHGALAALKGIKL